MEELNLSFNTEDLDQTRSSDIESIKDGTSYYRLFPWLAKKRPWAFHAIHWGFKDTNGNTVPVRCSYDREKFCPVCEKVWAAENILKELGDDGDPKEKEPLEEFVNQYRADKAYYFNALTAEGQVKKLKLKPSYVTGMRQEKEGELIVRFREAVQDKHFDPLSLDGGCWFKFTRSGKGYGTTYKVDFKRTSTMQDNELIEKIDRTALSKQFPEVYEAVKTQLEGAETGPLFDVYSLYAIRTSSELKKFLDGEPVPTAKRNGGASLSIGPITELAQDSGGETPAVEVSAPSTVENTVQVTAPVQALSAVQPSTPIAHVAVTHKVRPLPAKTDPAAVAAKVAEQRARLASLGIGTSPKK